MTPEAEIIEAFKRLPENDRRKVVELREPPSAGSRFTHYQVRSNITHRGKGVARDHYRVFASLGELLRIFHDVLEV
jgi:hypothetical protein